MDGSMFFDGWSGIFRVLVVGTCAYAALVAILRVTGKRTLSKMNAFDFIVTVAFGSTLATVLLSRNVPLAEGVVALALLCALQYVVTYVSVRSERFQALIKAQPALLFHRGDFLHDALRRERVTREEVLAALREQGRTGISGIEAVVLETNGSLTVLKAQDEGMEALGPVRGAAPSA